MKFCVPLAIGCHSKKGATKNTVVDPKNYAFEKLTERVHD